MHLSLAFPGVDPRDTPGETPGTCGEWCILVIFLGARGRDIVQFWKRTHQTPGVNARALVDIGQRYDTSGTRLPRLPPFFFPQVHDKV